MRTIKQSLFFVLFSIVFSHNCPAQQDDPVYALDKINEAIAGFDAKYLAYQSAIAHGSRVRKCEKKRQEMMTQLDNARYAIAEVPYYKGDKSLHQSSTSYLKLVQNLLNENYEKIVDLEDIAEQSYDAMEAYILLRRKVDEKMEEASKQNHEQVVAYCAKQNIKLTNENASENSLKMKKVSDVMDYYNQVYLTFFKSSVQESHFMDAMAKKNVTAMEQSKSAMTKYTEEGLASLDTIGNFSGDGNLKLACKKTLQFFKKEAMSANDLTDYFLKQEAFAKVQKNFEHSSKAQNDQAEIDKFNAAIKDMNKALDNYNKTNETLNRGRDDVYKNWNDGVKAFMDAQVPYAK
jgi:hypothetical protein